ncbi:hypothetical protein Bhyg_07391 [Pseudolycoriella hygida]|uniref:Uncharacterized protein n=1 Tax=Pseudolycoriella hygida TaxID=35572 RepID=A0A9Q0N2M1_9DIPT|nr:hypothetical protein Bhyg_07391 [Pseudolycoriella hygida]
MKPQATCMRRQLPVAHEPYCLISPHEIGIFTTFDVVKDLILLSESVSKYQPVESSSHKIHLRKLKASIKVSSILKSLLTVVAMQGATSVTGTPAIYIT